MDEAFQRFLFKWGAWSLADHWLQKVTVILKWQWIQNMCRAWNQVVNPAKANCPGKHVCVTLAVTHTINRLQRRSRDQGHEKQPVKNIMRPKMGWDGREQQTLNTPRG